MPNAVSDESSSRSSAQPPNNIFYIFDPDFIRPGDILLTRAPSLKSHAIRKLTKSDFSHAAICIEYGSFIEAIGSGVCRFSIMAAGVRDRSNVRLLRLKDTIPNARRIAETAAEFAHQDLARKYSLAGAIGVVVPSPKKPDEASLFCSQLVMEAYDKITSPLLPGKEAEKIAPGHLVASPYLEDVTDQALRVTSSDEPSWCLDDTSPFQRPHQWEVITKLKMLGRKSIKRAVKRLNGNARSFYELELLLRDTKDAELDRTIVTALVATDFCEIYYSKAVDRFDEEKEQLENSLSVVEALATGSKEISSRQLSAEITDTKQAIAIFEDDLGERREQHRLYIERSAEGNLETFALLGALQEKCINLNQEALNLLKRKLTALEAVKPST